ncbi:glycosyltransferase involved in cell wall biosynthesis [Winogradskyella epiphytica]|uniref:Glycosyltransferase involved in cell wall biosynthesis n=1 Tax=Winogradskyella epiphytica TaxID=262005 RepID=A0A2V4XIZ5_9FLAO|nr:glycosyltransferase [Winogradskyella epiphytica]PYE83290.1 glycosyltransferase involved in cell wall biosynthesis [Winogradskyella epiphytica]GGW57082.1 glycosyltransferase family 1 (GT1) [Winogradskyella epiphytica]
MNKIKVAHVLHSVGGVDVYLRLVTENINPNEIENIIIHQQEENDKLNYFAKDKTQVREYKLPIQREISLIQDFKSIISTIKILRKEKPDLIHAHSAKGGIIARTASLFYRVNVLHTPHAYSFLSAESNFKKSVFLTIERIFKHVNSYLLATSKSELQQGIVKVGYKKERALLFNNSILPIKTFKELSIDKSWPDNYICSVGRPSYQKNIEFMIDVIYELKKSNYNIHLVLMGVGFHAPNLNVVKEKIKELDLVKNVTLLDWTSRDDIFNIIKDSQLYISTSRYEGLPYSVIESLALRKPIVATNCDGNKDLVKHEYNGYLVQNESVVEMSGYIENILNSEELKLKFSENSFQYFLDNFDLTKNIEKLEQQYKNLVKTKK